MCVCRCVHICVHCTHHSLVCCSHARRREYFHPNPPHRTLKVVKANAMMVTRTTENRRERKHMLCIQNHKCMAKTCAHIYNTQPPAYTHPHKHVLGVRRFCADIRARVSAMYVMCPTVRGSPISPHQQGTCLSGEAYKKTPPSADYTHKKVRQFT